MSTKVVVASENPVKRRAAIDAVRMALGLSDVTAVSVEVASGVAPQPHGDEETLRGARQRAEAARLAVPDAAFWIGLEGGVVDRDGTLECMAWVVVLGVVDPGTEGKLRRGESRTATYELPAEMADLLRSGVELGAATDKIFGATGTKTGSGTVGPLTGGVIDRVSYYAHALVLALVPFRNQELTFSEGSGALSS